MARRAARARCPAAEPSPAPTACGTAPTSVPVNSAKMTGRSPAATLRAPTRSVSLGSQAPRARSAGRRRAPPARCSAARTSARSIMCDFPNGLHDHSRHPWPSERHGTATGAGSHRVGTDTRGRTIALAPAGQRGTVHGRYCMPRRRRGVALGHLEREHVTERTVTGCSHQPSKHGPESHGAPPLCGGGDGFVPAFITRPQPTTRRRRESSRGLPLW